MSAKSAAAKQNPRSYRLRKRRFPLVGSFFFHTVGAGGKGSISVVLEQTPAGILNPNASSLELSISFSTVLQAGKALYISWAKM